MIDRFTAALVASLSLTAFAAAQGLPPPIPLYPGAQPRSIEPEALPPLPSSPAGPPGASSSMPDYPPPSTTAPDFPPLTSAPNTPPDFPPPPVASNPPAAPPLSPAPLSPAPLSPPPLSSPAVLGPATQRIFCDQPVAIHFADAAALPERYRQFVGIWSDASWTPQLCAALIVENVQTDGTASIVYVYGPMGSNNRRPGGVLHGTGVIRNGELRFQNSDGTQFAFRPLYADLDGHLTTPQGQSYQAVFKKTL
ncbi:MAG: hypothetical protein JO058_04785 [Alphaproteobacteria bacterium]|nr:hypothetical protein [Alphaproteobacteria bacterium]